MTFEAALATGLDRFQHSSPSPFRDRMRSLLLMPLILLMMAGSLVAGANSYDTPSRTIGSFSTNSGSLNGTTASYQDGWRVMKDHGGSDNNLQQYNYGNHLNEVSGSGKLDYSMHVQTARV